MSVESVSKCIVSVASKQKHLTVTEKIKLLDFYENENMKNLTNENESVITKLKL